MEGYQVGCLFSFDNLPLVAPVKLSDSNSYLLENILNSGRFINSDIFNERLSTQVEVFLKQLESSVFLRLLLNTDEEENNQTDLTQFLNNQLNRRLRKCF